MTQAELFCLMGFCGKWTLYLWYGLSPIVLAAGPTIRQRRVTVWSMRCGYILALGQLLLGYAAGVYPAWMVFGTAALGIGLHVRLERHLALTDHDASRIGVNHADQELHDQNTRRQDGS